MKPALIAISRNPASTTEYHISIQDERGKTIKRKHRAGHSSGEAAAVALSEALVFSQYVVVGEDAVLSHIPKDLRSKTNESTK